MRELVYEKLAIIALQLHETEQSSKLYEKALTLYPNSSTLINSYGMMLMQWYE